MTTRGADANDGQGGRIKAVQHDCDIQIKTLEVCQLSQENRREILKVRGLWTPVGDYHPSHFDYKHCFICGISVEQRPVTEEHILSQWLLRRFDLWDRTITLLNWTDIKYSQLKIPCCSVCNNDHLSRIEKEVQQGVEQGFEKFRQIDELTIYQWLAKIRFGILFKELSLDADRGNKELGKIIGPKVMHEHQNLHRLLQSVRLPFRFISKPWSVWILRSHTYPRKYDFDFWDFFESLTVYIRMHDTAVIMCLEDNAYQQEARDDFFKQFDGVTLHPCQLEELAVRVSYQNALLRRTPEYDIDVHPVTGEYIVSCKPLQRYPGENIFDAWIPEHYARTIYHLWKRAGFAEAFEDIFPGDGTCFTTLYDEHGNVNVLDKYGQSMNLIRAKGSRRKLHFSGEPEPE